MKIVIIGDKSRYQFFRDFIDEKYTGYKEPFYTERISERDVFMTSNIKEKGENIYISKKLPLNTLVFFPKEYSEGLYGQQDKIVIFDEFPYVTEENLLKLKNIIETGNYNQIEVVLIINNRERLESDISTEEMALKEAETIYKRKNIKVSKYKFGESPTFLFSSIDSIQNNNQLKPLLNDLKFVSQIFSTSYELMYEESELNKNLSNPEFINSFFEYNRNIIGKNIWRYYFEKIFNYFWKDNSSKIDDFYIKFYEMNLKNFCIWDISVDIEELKIEIRKLFMNKLYFPKEYIFYGDKPEYEKLLNKLAKDFVNLKKELINFFTNDIKQYLKQRIEKNINKLEALLNECSN